MLVFRNLSIRRKQTLVIMLTSTVSLLLACAAFVAYDVSQFRTGMVESVSSLAEVVGNNTTAAIDFDDPSDAAETLAALRGDPNIVLAHVYTLDGRAFAAYVREGALPPPKIPLFFEARDKFTANHLHVFRPISQGGEQIGTIELVANLNELRERLWRYAGIAGLVLVIALVVAFWLSSRLQKLISDPILHLARVARSVAQEKNYSVRATRHSNDELGQLVDGFNDMLAQIQERDGALQATRDQLEGRVAERTRELQRTEALYRQAITGAGAVPYSNNSKTHSNSFMGEGIQQLIGYAPHEVNGALWGKIVQESIMLGEAAGLDKDEAARRVARGELMHWRHDMRVTARDGKSRWISDASVQILDEAGQVTGSVGILQDITERKQAEHTALAFSKLGRDLSCAASREAAAKVIGEVADELFGWDAAWVQLYSKKDDTVHNVFDVDTLDGRRIYATQIEPRKTTELHRRILTRGGELILRDAEGFLPGALAFGDKSRPSASLMFVPIRSGTEAIGILSIQSYSPTAYTEEDLARLQALADQCGGALARIRADEARRDSEFQFRLVWNNSADGLRLTDREGTVLMVNDAYCRMTGKSKAEVEGQPLSVIHADANADFVMRSFRQRMESNSLEAQMEVEVTLWNGKTVWFELSNSFLELPGQPTLVLNIFRDITERKRAQAELEHIHKQLVDASRRGGMAEIATNVLHNVGNVLNSVNISTGLIVESVKKSRAAGLARVVALLREHAHDLGEFITHDSRGKHLPAHLAQLSEHLAADQAAIGGELESLRRNVEHIKEIVALQQSYAIVGGVKEMVNVVNLVEDSLRMNEGALSRHRVEVLREFEPVPPMNVEKHKILQILVNLVRNAKYACDESERADNRLTMRVANGDGRVRISVIDNGVGISPENLTQVFNHGFTTRKGGHGFGLHSGALAAKEMGGSLTAHSDGPGQGATFTLELPCPTPEDSHE